jgi:hypothetical protein
VDLAHLPGGMDLAGEGDEGAKAPRGRCEGNTDCLAEVGGTVRVLFRG